MDHSENPNIAPLPVQSDEKTAAFNPRRELSGTGGTAAEAYQIAAELYGAHPPADYVEQVRQGLNNEDH